MQGAIAAVYPPKADLERAFRAVRHARVPQVPAVVLALRDELARPEPDLRRTAELIGQDQALTGQLLKTINSPLFFCPTKIASVQQAVTLMGLSRLANLVTAETVKRMLGTREGASGAVCRSITEQVRVITALAPYVEAVNRDEAYLFAMMHDVGGLVFADLLPDYGSEWTLRNAATPRSLIEYERAALGVDHATVGFLLAGTWRLPEFLALAIYQHHCPEPPHLDDARARSLIAMGKLADYLIAASQGTQDTSEMQDYRDSALQELEIGPDDWRSICGLAVVG